MDSGSRPLRADAARNRARVLEAARALFAVHGLDAQMEDVARLAGVGVGTIYRHYPTKERLIQELLAERMRLLAEEARAAHAAEPTAWAAFCRFLRAVAAVQLVDRSLVHFIAGRIRANEALRTAQSELLAGMQELIAAAQAEGALRPGIAPGDVPVLLSGVGQSVWLEGEQAAELAERYLAVVLDGLRAPGATELPGRPLSPADLDRVLFADDPAEQ